MSLELVLEGLWDYRKYIPISLIVSFLIGVVNLLLGWYKHNKELRLNHSRDLVKNIQNPHIFLNREKKNLILEVRQCSDNLNEHLGDATYKDEKKLIERRDFYVNKLHNEELNEFCSELNDSIFYYIKQRNYTEYDFSRPSMEQTDYFNKETIELDILQIVINNHGASTPISFTIQHHNLYYLYYGGSIWVAGDDERKLKEIAAALTKEVNGAFKRKTFELILWYHSEIKEYQTHINEALEQLINKVEVGVPLKGKCKKCPKEDTLLEYIWQCIKRFLP